MALLSLSRIVVLAVLWRQLMGVLCAGLVLGAGIVSELALTLLWLLRRLLLCVDSSGQRNIRQEGIGSLFTLGLVADASAPALSVGGCCLLRYDWVLQFI